MMALLPLILVKLLNPCSPWAHRWTRRPRYAGAWLRGFYIKELMHCEARRRETTLTPVVITHGTPLQILE